MSWAPCFTLGQYPSSPSWWWERIVQDCLRPMVQALRIHAHARITLVLHASTTEQLYEHGYQAILEELSDACLRGQIEFAETTYTPLVLPLVSWDEAMRQIKKNHEINRIYLGSHYDPGGFFLPYGAYHRAGAELLASLGYRWILLDSTSSPTSGPSGAMMLQGIPHLRCVTRSREASLALIANSSARPLAPLKAMLAQSPWCITSVDLAWFGCYQRSSTNMFSSLFAVRSLPMSSISELPLDTLQNGEPVPSSGMTREADLAKGIPFRVFNDPENHLHGTLNAFITRAQELWAKALREQSVSPDLIEKYDRIAYHDSALWASGEAWRSFTMVHKGVQPLLEVVRALQGVSEASRAEVQMLYERIILDFQGGLHANLSSRMLSRHTAGAPNSWDHMANDAIHAWEVMEEYHGAACWRVIRERMTTVTSDIDRMALIDELSVVFRAIPHLPLCG